MAGINSKVELRSSIPNLRARFSDKTERGILRGTLRKTARSVLVKAARRNLRNANGRRFAKDVTVKTKVTNFVATAFVGAKKGTVLAKVGHLFERGTRPHTLAIKRKKAMVTKDGIFIGKRAQHPGTSPRPWLNPALDDNKGKAIRVFVDNLRIEINRAVAKGKR